MRLSLPNMAAVVDKTLHLNLPTNMPERDQKKRVSVDRCKMYHNLSDDFGVPNYLPAVFDQVSAQMVARS